MADSADPAPPPEATPPPADTIIPAQLSQVRAPLDEAGVALSTPDSAGRLPIVILPEHPMRIRNELVVAGVVVLVIGIVFDLSFALRGGALGLGALLIVLGVFRSFMIPVPEGTRAILLRRGRVYRTLGPGAHIVPPWIAVSHIVSMRETPFDAPALEVPTRDDVRTNVDILLTFRISAPEVFVFAISAPDFDQVCQATCQEAVRLVVRGKTSEEVLDLAEADATRLKEIIGAALLPYGVEAVRVVVTHVTPPVEFMASRESRRLAILQRAEQAERHELEVLVQRSSEQLERARIQARHNAIELEAENEVARLERLEERIRTYPAAMRWDVESQRLDVARALAGNTRAMVQVGPAGDVAASLLLHTLPDESPAPGAPSANGGTQTLGDASVAVDAASTDGPSTQAGTEEVAPARSVRTGRPSR